MGDASQEVIIFICSNLHIRSSFNVSIFQFLPNSGNSYISSKYMHNRCPSLDFTLNWWLKWTTHWVLHNQCKILYFLNSNLEQRSYLNLHASACFLQNCINCCTRKNKTHPKSNYLCKTTMTTLTFLFTSLPWILKDFFFLFNNFILFINPLHKLWLRLHLFMTLLVLWSFFKLCVKELSMT